MYRNGGALGTASGGRQPPARHYTAPMLAEPPPAALFALGLLALVAGGLWLRSRKWPLLVAAAVLLLLLLGWIAAGVLLDTPRKQAERRVQAMAAALSAKNWEQFAENVSDRFDSNGLKKADLRRKFEQGTAYNVKATAWDFAPTDPPRATETEVVLQFEGKATPPTGEPFMLHFEATFAKDPDGKFRMRSFTPFDYVQKNQKATLP